jgi:hypothetical protein
MPGAARAGEDILTEYPPLGGLAVAYLVQQLPRRCRQRLDVIGRLLGGRARLAPDASAKVNVSPAHGENFATPRASQQQQTEDVGDVLIGMRRQRRGQPVSSSPDR